MLCFENLFRLKLVLVSNTRLRPKILGLHMFLDVFRAANVQIHILAVQKIIGYAETQVSKEFKADGNNLSSL